MVRKPIKVKPIKKVPVRRPAFREHPFIEAFNHAGQVLTDLGGISSELV